MVGASKKLRITQSAVSQRLKKLEQELGVLLFTRLHKRLLPTREGTVLFEMVAPFIEQLEEGIRFLQRAREEPMGLLKVGAPVEFGQSELPRVFAMFREQYPEVRFSLELGHPSVLLPQLRAGDLDFSFADIFSHKWELMDQLDLFAIEPIFEEELVLVGAEAYCVELEDGEALSLWSLLARATFVVYKTHAPSIRSWLAHHTAGAKEEPPQDAFEKLNISLIVESVRAAITAVKHRMGMALLPSHLVEEDVASGLLRILSTSSGPMINKVSLLQLQDKVPTMTERVFLQFCKSHLKRR